MPGKKHKSILYQSIPNQNTEGTHIIGLNESKSKKEEKIADQKLWLKLKIGSREAFKELFLKYNNVLTRYGCLVVNDPCLIEDCIHDLFLYIWSKRESLVEVESVKYYLIVSFRRRVFKALGEKEKGTKILEGIKFEYPKYEDFFEREFITLQSALEREKAVMLAVGLLPSRQKEVLHFRYVEGLPYQEISYKMGISNVSVRKLAYKAIKNLRKNIFSKR